MRPRTTVLPGAATLTTADSVTDPPGPVQLRVNVVVAVSEPVDSVPEVSFDPDQPPEAVHVAAFVLVHVNVVAPVAATCGSLAVSANVGGGLTTVTVDDCEADPPEPAQVSV